MSNSTRCRCSGAGGARSATSARCRPRGAATQLYQEMIWLYASNPAARDELGTDEVLQRARGDLVALT